MTGPGWRMVAAAWLLGTGLVAASPGRANPAPADSRLHVEWTAAATGQGQSRIFGYVYNDHREDAVNVELRITELDASGQPVASVIRPVGDAVAGGSRAFFDTLVPGHGPSYAVVVESFDFMTDGEWQTRTTEQLLTSEGFEKKIADTPQKLAHLETLTPARKLVARRRDGQIYYVYADPAVCKCLYVGTAAQYQRVLDARLENEQLQAVQDHVEYYDPILWSLWAP
jgi:hypothetical protein